MKKLTLLALCALLSVGAFAQKAKSKKAKSNTVAAPATSVMNAEKTEKEESTKWPQLEVFHKAMATTFHPAEKGDFTPIRKKSGELMDAMKNLIGNPFPKPYQTAEMKVMVAQLEEQVTTVYNMVNNGASDQELMAALNNAHEAFHKVAGACSKEEHHD